MNWSVFGKAFLCETVYAIPFFILSILPFKKQLRFPIKILILFIFIGQLLQSSLYTYLISHGKPTRVTDTVFAFVSLAIYFKSKPCFREISSPPFQTAPASV